MADKDFSIAAKKFGATESDIAKMHNGGIYYAAIDVKEYAKDPCGYSCIIYDFDIYNEDPANFVDWAPGMEQAQQTISRALSEIVNTIYKDIVYTILNEHWQDFTVWTAASSLHHNMLGGLLVHTAEVVEQSEEIANFWTKKYGENFINRPLLISAALLHDIAKTQELKVDRLSGSTEYSTQAALETHITMCVSMIDVTAYRFQLGYQTYSVDANGNNLPAKSEEQLIKEKEAVSLLKHCILAHHGKLEWGSAINMNCPEVYIINKADELSAEMFRYNKNFKEMESGSSNLQWLNGNMVNIYKDSTK
jgi:3'-5' exoribonuclease